MCVKYYYYIQQFESYKVYSDKKVPTSKIWLIYPKKQSQTKWMKIPNIKQFALT